MLNELSENETLPRNPPQPVADPKSAHANRTDHSIVSANIKACSVTRWRNSRLLLFFRKLLQRVVEYRHTEAFPRGLNFLWKRRNVTLHRVEHWSHITDPLWVNTVVEYRAFEYEQLESMVKFGSTRRWATNRAITNSTQNQMSKTIFQGPRPTWYLPTDSNSSLLFKTHQAQHQNHIIAQRFPIQNVVRYLSLIAL